MTPQQRAQFEQALATIRDTLPPACWTFYQSCVNEGFNEAQSLHLTTHYLTLLISSSAQVIVNIDPEMMDDTEGPEFDAGYPDVEDDYPGEEFE